MRLLKNIVKQVLLGLLLIALNGRSFAQTFALPDTNFRNVLLANYPAVMTGNELNIAAANSFGFDLIIPNANISDLTGVHYFSSIYKLDANGNKITTVPDLSPCTNLAYLYLNDNLLSNVNFLLGNTNMLQIQLFNNNLSSFPELPGFTTLQQLFVGGNQIKWMTGLSYLPNLRYFHIGSNQFDSLPDISQNTAIRELYCDQNNIKALNGVENLVNLRHLNCWNNQITDLSPLNTITTLQDLYANKNLLTSLPVLTNKPALSRVIVQKNKLSFEDLLPVAALTGLTNFTYAPQDSVGEEVNYNIRRLDNAMFTPAVDAAVSSNSYTWFKDNTLLPVTSRDYTINKAQPSDSGSYSVEITNPALPLLTLRHKVWRLMVNSSCMDVVSYGYKILDKDCEAGTEIQIELLTDGAQLPMLYTLNSIGRADSVVHSSEIIPNVPSGKYILSATDQRGCRITADDDLTIYRSSDCDPVIFPLSNGPQSTYFIEESGLARIIDINGVVIRELNAPAVWDGTKNDGSFADTAYYVITINNKKLTNISVIK